MIDDLIANLHLLNKADSLVARIWLNNMARRLGLVVFAGLIAVFGLGMANIAAFYGLQTFLGPVWAAAIIAAVDLALAVVVMVVSRNLRPGAEIELAFDIRKMAIESIQADARDLKTSLDTLVQEVLEIRESIAGFVHNPLDAAAQKLLVPAAISIIRGLRVRKDGT